MDLALNNLQWLMCLKTKPKQTKSHGFNCLSLQTTTYKKIAKLLTHPRIIEKAIYAYYQNIAKLLTQP